MPRCQCGPSKLSMADRLESHEGVAVHVPSLPRMRKYALGVKKARRVLNPQICRLASGTRAHTSMVDGCLPSWHQGWRFEQGLEP